MKKLTQGDDANTAPKLILAPGEAAPNKKESLYRLKLYYNDAHNVTGTQAQSKIFYSADLIIEREWWKKGIAPSPMRLPDGKTNYYKAVTDWHGAQRLLAFAAKLMRQRRVWYLLLIHNQMIDREGRGLVVYNWQNNTDQRKFSLPQRVYNPTYGHVNSETDSE